jgi:peptidyl-prolyl cis-trans isomerase SurA
MVFFVIWHDLIFYRQNNTKIKDIVYCRNSKVPMKALTISFVITIIFTSFSFGQFKPDQVLVTINKHQVTAGEFERVYLKNSQVGTSEKESVQSYFDLYVKFKLKVIAAIDSGLDTLASFKNELKGYKEQLAKNYLTDNDILDKLVKEAYFRTSNEVNSSHIMILLPNNPSPKDTLIAWQKIEKIRERINKGESFEQLASELSEDLSSKPNKGYLGYFPCFRLPYVFENATYNTAVGSVSLPVRTRFGYHLIKINNKRPSPGEVKVAHIMVASPENSSEDKKIQAEQKINDIYSKIKNGESFDTLARKFSDDQYSAHNNGELQWFGTQMMVPEFEEVAFSLKNKGEISKPVKTRFGWHIIKLLDTRPVPTFENIQGDLKSKIAKNDRNEIIQQSFINRLKNEYKPQINKRAIEGIYKLDTLIYKAETKLNLCCDTNATFLTIQKTKYPVNEFLEWIRSNRNQYNKWPATDFINHISVTFTDKKIMDYENSNLEKKYPDFANLSQEYFEGILLFNIMEQKVWTKASSDSIGLQVYYDNNKDKYNKPDPKPLNEIRGIVMSDYQNFLEENWLADLRKKYPVVVDTKLLNKIEQKYNKK